MKKQIVLLGDAHLSFKNGNREIFEEMMSYLEKEVFTYLLKNKSKIEFIVWLGDLYDSRESVNVYVAQEVKKRIFDFLEKHEIKSYFIAGNHDLFFKDKDSHSALLLYDTKYEFVEIVMKNKIVEFAGKKIELCGYLSEPQKQANYLFGHFDIKTFKMNSSIESAEGLNPVFFSDYEKVKTGHYHFGSKKHNIEFVGSLFWLTKNDFGDIKKFQVIFDDFTEQNIYNNISPRFIKVNYNEKNSNAVITITGVEEFEKTFTYDEALRVIKNNYVLLTIEEYENVALLDEFKDKISKLYEVLNKKVITPNGQIRKQVTYSDLKTGISSYFDETTFPDNINISKIKNKSLELYEKALKEEK